MRIRILKSYYAKLTLFCLAVLFLLVLLISSLFVYYLRFSQKSDAAAECDACLQDLIQEYDDIQKKYYKVLEVLYDSDNRDDMADFCKGKSDGALSYGLHNRINRIFREASLQDERIRGIYLHSFYSEMRYMYSTNTNSFVNVYYEPDGMVEESKNFQRIVIGGRLIEFDNIKNVNVFGIQSGILEAGENANTDTYQIVVFYSLDDFDQILDKYQVRSDTRFLLTTIEGEIIYDSQGNYGRNEVIYYENNSVLLEEKEDTTEDTKLYLKRESYKQNMYLAFYIASSRNNPFRFERSNLLVLLLVIVVWGAASVMLLIFYRLLKKKFETIECGIEQIGKNRMDYRMPVAKKEDEFTRIAIRFNQMCDELEKVIDQNYVYGMLCQKAEYEAWQGMVNPHFLYNSLEAIREKLVENGQEDCSEMILLLSRIFEYQVRGENMVSVSRELAALRTYMEFMYIRYQYGFEYYIDFEEEILDCMVPKLVFQPILENYFVHGLRSDGSDSIHIRGWIEETDDRIHVSFCDNGRGMTEEKAEMLRAALEKNEKDSAHIGLCSVNSRLQIVFGKDGYVDIRRNDPEPGVCISLIFGKSMKLFFKAGNGEMKDCIRKGNSDAKDREKV